MFCFIHCIVLCVVVLVGRLLMTHVHYVMKISSILKLTMYDIVCFECPSTQLLFTDPREIQQRSCLTCLVLCVIVHVVMSAQLCTCTSCPLYVTTHVLYMYWCHPYSSDNVDY